jgi:flagellar biosynthetic protein FlhB
LPEQFGDKQFEATPHRREQAREQGQVPRSHDLASAVILVGGLVLLMWLGESLVTWLQTYFTERLGGEAWLAGGTDTLLSEQAAVLSALARTLLPLLALILALAVAASLGQTGILFLPQNVAPQLERLNPLRGLGRIFSLANLARTVFGVGKLLVVATVAYYSLRSRVGGLLGLAELSTAEIAWFLADVLLWTSLQIGLALLVLALLDYLFQRWKHEQDLRMTVLEVKQEMKEQQGDPQIIARRKAVQRQLAMNRLSKLIPQADFVVTNPTELAVALKYDEQTMVAPVVTAKGAGKVAQFIRRLALEHGVPVIERKPLAQALYQLVDVGQPVPRQLWEAVAEVVRYVSELKGQPLPGSRTPR